jgi:hypothetical protein
VADSGRRVLIIAARQPAFAELLEQAGYEVAVRTRPLDDAEAGRIDADLAVVFRGRLIGRAQASLLADRDVPVIEILTVEPPGSSSAGWIRVSNRMTKSDLVQLVHAAADWASSPLRPKPSVAA